ncbi:beta-1,6-N-acetylglucosaminyltransferase [Zobellella taiwanensis]
MKTNNINITYLILAHDNPARLQNLIEKLEEDPTATIVVHYDRKSPRKEYNQLIKANEHNPKVHILSKAQRVACGWGEFSIVKATLNLIRYALALPEQSDYCYLLSGACYPIKPLSELKAYLAEHKGTAFIECEDSGWIKAGMRDDRYLYHHFLNFRKHPELFRRLYKWQRHFNLKRKLPKDLNEIRFGSQWWCLPVVLLKELMEELRRSPETVRFFKTVWIPDECMFQSMVFKKPTLEIENQKTLTYYNFDMHGQPEAFEKEKLPKIDNSYFFIRKIF